jgi:hypothetical protein
MNKIDLAWVAGFWEGEGSIGCYNAKASKSYQFVVTFTQKNRLILEWLKKHFGGSIGYKVDNNSHYWSLCLSKANAIHCIELLRPYIKMPRRLRQIKRAYDNMAKMKKRIQWNSVENR